MENNDNIKRFKWSKVYLLQQKGTKFFYPVKRTEKNITFEYRLTDGGELQTLNAFVFVPEGCDYEAAGPIEWNGGEVFLEANRCIERGGKGRRNENGDHEVLIGNKWVKIEEMQDALKAMDEEFLKCLEK
jgi:hypothetical protein